MAHVLIPPGIHASGMVRSWQHKQERSTERLLNAAVRHMPMPQLGGRRDKQLRDCPTWLLYPGARVTGTPRSLAAWMAMLL